jgi:ABC transporter substrate binding protein
MNDEDNVSTLGLALLVAYSNRLSPAVTGGIGYGAIDGGFDFLRGSEYRVGVFAGYFVFNQAMNAFGCTAIASVICTPNPVPTSGSPVITENDKWDAVRIGIAAETMLTNLVKISGEAAYLPGVQFNGVDRHFIGNTGVLTEIFPASGKRNGVQLEASAWAGDIGVCGRRRRDSWAIRALGLQVIILHASTERDFDTVITTLRDRRAGALVIFPDAFFASQDARYAALLLQDGVPAISPRRDFALAGGFMSYGSSIGYLRRQLGFYTGRILKGEKPGDLPAEQATKIELTLNLKTAKAQKAVGADQEGADLLLDKGRKGRRNVAVGPAIEHQHAHPKNTGR